MSALFNSYEVLGTYEGFLCPFTQLSLSIHLVNWCSYLINWKNSIVLSTAPCFMGVSLHILNHPLLNIFTNVKYVHLSQ